MKYSNRTYTCTQNTVIEHSFPVLDNEGLLYYSTFTMMVLCLLYCSTGNSNSSRDSPDSPNSTDAFVVNYKKENIVSMSTVIPSGQAGSFFFC